MGLEDVVMTMFILWIITAVLAAIGWVMLTLLGLLTPGFTFLKARLKKKPILRALNPDRKEELIIGEYDEGLAVTSDKKKGFFVDKDAVVTDRKSGVTMLPCNSEIGLTLSQKILEIMAGLKSMGCENIVEAMQYDEIYGRCDACGYEGFMNVEPELNDKGEAIGIKRLKCPYEGDEHATVQEKGE